MSVDILRDKIRKTKNPMMLHLTGLTSQIPPRILEQAQDPAEAAAQYYSGLLHTLKESIPSIRFSFSGFAMLGSSGTAVLSRLLAEAKKLGFYTVLDAPGPDTPEHALLAAQAAFGPDAAYPCDGMVIPAYLGSDIYRVFLPYCKEGKSIFPAVRTPNRSGAELQDLLTGSRQVHVAAADLVNRCGSDTAGKYGYQQLGIAAAASSAESLRNLRGKYPKLFLLVDGMDLPNANAKNCSYAFDRFGHGAVCCVSAAIVAAWKQETEEAADAYSCALAAAMRLKKNLSRYISVM